MVIGQSRVPEPPARMMPLRVMVLLSRRVRPAPGRGPGAPVGPGDAEGAFRASAVEAGVERPRRRCGVVGGGDVRPRRRSAAGAGEDLARKAGPARVGRAGEVVGAAEGGVGDRARGRSRDAGPGNGVGGGRAAALVADDREMVAGLRRAAASSSRSSRRWPRTPRRCAGSHGRRRPRAPPPRRRACCGHRPRAGRWRRRGSGGRRPSSVEHVVGGEVDHAARLLPGRGCRRWRPGHRH